MTPEAVEHDRLDWIRAEQIRALYQTVPIGVVGALVASSILTGVLLRMDMIAPGRVLAWLGVTLVSGAWQLWLCRRYRRAQPGSGEWRVWAGRYNRASLVEGLRWGLGSIWLAAPGDVSELLWVVLVTSGAASASVGSVGSYLPSFYRLILPAMVPITLWCGLQGDAPHGALFLMGAVFIVAVGFLAARANAHLVEALTLRFENHDLAEDLRRQKERAEQASLDKSRFLAAASHDLRQPVHALGLFVGALQGRQMDDGARRLVQSIERSVEAMDGLFNALLDISQLDAGVVHPVARRFAIQPVLDRICRDHAAEAWGKGVRLVLHPSSAVVQTDPILLERVLRNLVSNAVRYTAQGRVVVGCRRGPALSVQVWDTGPGIAPEHQARMFEEFYQAHNPERDRSKGLGLGLAIVRRLTALLDCALSFQSAPGRGSVFRVAVPLAEAADMEAPAADATMPGALRRGMVLVVDDEAAVRDGMGSLLSQWGHHVVTAGSYAEARAALDAEPGVPDLMICDYRLRDGDTGAAVIHRLRFDFGTEIPALLVTGDTAPDRLKEAESSGLLLLHKPVASGKLRAAVGNLMA